MVKVVLCPPGVLGGSEGIVDLLGDLIATLVHQL